MLGNGRQSSSFAAKALLQFGMTELINSANLAEHATFPVGVIEESHQPPGQPAVQCKPATCEQEAAIGSLEKGNFKTYCDCSPYPSPDPDTESAAEPKRNCCGGSHSQEGRAVAGQCCAWIGSYSWIRRCALKPECDCRHEADRYAG